MTKSTKGRWFKIGLFNLAIVALYGAIMRYKIAYDLPLFDQKHLLHAHSHFAFSGWISHLLYSGLMLLLTSFLPENKLKKYTWLIAANLLCAFGMLIAFTLQGYKFASISFSTLSIIVAILFAWHYIRDSQLFSAGNASKPWAAAGLLLNVLASLGPFSLACMLATKNIDHNLYLGSIYYYLHFQYNGWFFFGSMALVITALPQYGHSFKKQFRIFAYTVVPTFFLSLLWIKIPSWLYVLTVLATLLQLFAWLSLVLQLWKIFRQNTERVQPQWINIFFVGAALALTIKFILQAISVIPSLSQLVFGFRPIVIAYLHLILLGVYSLFLIGWMITKKLIRLTPALKTAAFAFLTGVILNELLLAIQGCMSFSYLPVPYINEMLLATAIILFASAAGMAIAQIRKPAV